MRRFALCCAVAAQLLVPVNAIARQQDFALQGHALPEDKVVTVVLMRPDVSVGELQGGGVAEPNADWTETARTHIETALVAELEGRGLELRKMEILVAAASECTAREAVIQPQLTAALDVSAADAADESDDVTGDSAEMPRDEAVDAAAMAVTTEEPAPGAETACVPLDPSFEQTLADYRGLHSVVVGSILAHKYGYGAGRLPTKKNGFDYTLGPGTVVIGDVADANYGLFVLTNDQFASSSRKAMQVAGALGCIIGACMIVSGGVHVAYVSLVDLETGNIVWFNVLRGSEGDVREEEGAREMVRAIMASMPTRPGQVTAPSEGADG